ncbi:MAG: hypothetical protein J6W29_10200 [Neisseriaceae bacterium]|nr:hypothetical protein [Neisseriaceae bacterium]
MPEKQTATPNKKILSLRAIATQWRGNLLTMKNGIAKTIFRQPEKQKSCVIASRQTGVSNLLLTPVSLRDCVSNRGNPIKLNRRGNPRKSHSDLLTPIGV